MPISRDRIGCSPEPEGRSRPLRALLARLALALFVSLSLAICDREPGPGPLEPPPDARVLDNLSGFRAIVGRAFTFGLLFIENHGDEVAILDGVELIDPTEGIQLVGARVADVTGRPRRSGDDTFPPGRPGGQRPLAGYRVAPGGTNEVQLLLGVRLIAEGQHGFRAVAALYHVGENSFRYVIASGLVACSPSFYEERDRRSCLARDPFQPTRP
jgi:hypothetical protein